MGKLHAPVGGADAQARHRIDHHPQPVPAVQGIVPAIGLIAIHARGEFAPKRAAQDGLDFGGQCSRLCDCPLRQQAGVHQRESVLDVHQRPCAQPGQQLVAIGRGEDFVQGIALVDAGMAGRHRHQVQVVIAQHAHRCLAEPAHEAQHLQRVGTAIDQVAHQPEPVAGAVEADQFEQFAELRQAALEIADRVCNNAGI